MKHKLFRLFFVLIFVIGLAMAPTPQSVRAAGAWYVSTTGDDANDCQNPTTTCATINGAIGKASSGETVYVAEGTYTGSGSEVVLLDKDITLSGGWDDAFITQSAASTLDGQGLRRGITVNSGVTIVVERILAQNGNAGSDGGGGIWNAGVMTLSGSTINGNTASSGAGIFNFGTANLINNTISGNTSTSLGGGGIQNIFGTLTITDSTFSANSAIQSGGSIRNYGGAVTIINSTFSDNSAGSGGGITNEGNGTLTVTDSTFSANSADQGGGGIETNGTLAVTNSTFSANSADQGGGIISYGGTVTVTNSTVSSNTASSYGGGIFNTAGTVTLTDSTVNGNTTSSFGGGIYSDGTVTLTNSSVSSNIASATGGGILNNFPGMMTLTNSIVNGNTAAGGASGINNNGGTLTLINSTVSNNLGSFGGGGLNNSSNGTATLIGTTFSGNTATNSGGGAIEANSGTLTVTNSTFAGNSAALGGGLHATSGSVSLNNVTIANNTATDLGGGLYIYDGFGATVNLKNTILSDNLGPVSSPDCNGALSSQGYNLIQDTTGCTIDGDTTGNLTGVNPLLDPLQDNGGQTFTHALLSGSPAIDAGNPFGCTDQNGNPLTTDQRGVTRPQGTRCDIGAFELEQVVPPLVNDDFDNAVLIGALPFSDNRDTSTATSSFDDPTSCHNNGSVWYQFTPTSDTTIVANTIGSNYDTTISVFTGLPGALDLVPGGCNDDFYGLQSRVTFTATAGTTYYFMLGFCCGNGNNGGGNLVFSVEEILPPANDNFAAATSIDSLPSTIDFDTTAATFQSNEPGPSCAYPAPPYRTAWFAFTASQDGSISASIQNFNFSTFVAVYSGTDFNDLSQLGCGQSSNKTTFQAVSGQTYYFQVGGFYESGGTGQFLLETAPPPQASFYNNPWDPSKYDTIQFQDNSNDPGNVGFQTYTWNFGDGTTANGYSATHKYAADGDYQVTHTVTTTDGRTATVTQTVQVRTHDVAITKIATPNSANVGQTKTITVTLRNIAYPETVQIDLYKSTPNGFVWIATVTKSIPALSGNRTTAVSFSYTFTSDDAKLGKVTFKAVATIVGARDAYPSDNEAISSIIKVAK